MADLELLDTWDAVYGLAAKNGFSSRARHDPIETAFWVVRLSEQRKLSMFDWKYGNVLRHFPASTERAASRGIPSYHGIAFAVKLL